MRLSLVDWDQVLNGELHDLTLQLTKNNHLGCWFKYYNGDFTQPGLGGTCSNVEGIWYRSRNVAQIRIQGLLHPLPSLLSPFNTLIGKVYLMSSETNTVGITLYFADPSTPWKWFRWVDPMLLMTGYGGSEGASPPTFMYLSAKGTVGNQRIIEEGETFSVVYPNSSKNKEKKKKEKKIEVMIDSPQTRLQFELPWRSQLR